jgi:TRAP-type C4-dicarboxylate transport system permease small subunit
MREIQLLLRRVDRLVDVVTDWVSSLLLLMLTLVILYSVVMRYVFSQPPFWSDIVSMFANVAMILIGLSLTVRGRDLIAMQAIYEKISPALALSLDATWNALILMFAIVFTWYGFEAATQVPGFYWELGMLPQKYPMMIVPISGVLLIIASFGILIKDIRRFVDSKQRADQEGGIS